MVPGLHFPGGLRWQDRTWSLGYPDVALSLLPGRARDAGRLCWQWRLNRAGQGALCWVIWQSQAVPTSALFSCFPVPGSLVYGPLIGWKGSEGGMGCICNRGGWASSICESNVGHLSVPGSSPDEVPEPTTLGKRCEGCAQRAWGGYWWVPGIVSCDIAGRWLVTPGSLLGSVLRVSLSPSCLKSFLHLNQRNQSSLWKKNSPDL